MTWQGGIKPGSTITTTFSVALPTGKIKSYNVEFLDYTTGKFTSQYYNYAVDNGRIISSSISGSKVTYTIKSTLRGNVINDGLDITKNDQSELVAGKRFYMPVLITYTTASDTQKNGQYIFALGCRAAGQYINGTLYTIQDCNGNACMIKGTFVHCTGRCTGQGVK
ncbi:hypothetical protein [Aminipila sp.]|uniref:hypothetical protein n=1 Tax=Aminipila sp. TaxID=2060095 RepID=UPI0028975F65|nr:hypothetical protein [Aminipila sp.]